MSKEIYISSTPHETRLAIVEKDELTEIYYERENEYTLAGSIYNGRVTRVLPGMQSSFVDIGLERDAFLYITDFMEEAGDSADFESAAGNGSARSTTGDGGRSRSGDRPSRGEGRDRGRGQRDARDGRGREAQNGARDAQNSDSEAQFGGRRQAQDRGGVESSPESGYDMAEPRGLTSGEEEDFEASPTSGSHPPPGNNEDIGEGAPGADGSRRWRGRRGRRRGRGGSGEAADSTLPVEGTHGQTEEHDLEADTRSEDRSLREDQFAGEGREHSRERSGERGQERAAGARDSRHDAVRERFAPRGRRGESGWRGGRDSGRSEGRSAEGRYAEGRDHERDAERDDSVELSAAAEPFILPGESLSKYRRSSQPAELGDAAASASHAAPASAAAPLSVKPSTEIEPLVGWDGGLVLPGETLSRRRTSASEGGSEHRSENRGDYSRPGARDEGRREFSPGGSESGGRGDSRGRDRRRERDERSGRNRSRGLDAAEAVLPAVTSQHEPEATVLPFSDDAPDFAVAATETRLDREFEAAHEASHQTYEAAYNPSQNDVADSAENREAATAGQPSAEAPATASIADAPAAEPVREADSSEEFHETVAEYEPEENASATYRVDPAGASEFRQSAPVEELPVDVLETAGHDLSTNAGEAASEASPQHEFTALQPTGEMLSEPERGEDAEHEAGAPGPSPASPIEHEGAVQTEHLEQARNEAVSFPAASGSAAPLSFEPGYGQLEEELMDEDEGEIGTLHGSAFDDDTEEEALENSATNPPDVGSMIRDISIDEMTRPEPVELDEEEDEDEDFDSDEEDFEEDELDATSEDDLLDSEVDSHHDLQTGSEDELDAGDELSGSEISEAEEEEFAESGSFDAAPAERGDGWAGGEPASPGESAGREGLRQGRRDGRRGGRDRGGRDRRGMAGSRSNGSRERGGRSMQATDMPAISDLLKPGQEVLVQIAKEPIAKKGARITSHIALPGRFLVFMPTVSHVGVSRKIESDGERRRLKEILLSEKGEASGGFIVRTAASGASEEELRSDLRFLLNLWSDIKQRSESSKSPALIYHDLNLVERVLRDQVTDNFSAIWVDTETEYERVLRFLQRFQPSLIRRVKLYSKDTPLFEQFGITEEINKALRSKVWLKSGGSIVINQTEALVAIDINTGKYVGKTARLEDTIVKTNLDAIPEIVRQIRLRDLGGIIIIDFIDMDERKNRNRVMAALEDELKKDRAPSKVLQFNDFGLVAITRKRVKQSLERTLSTTCGVCAGTGMVKSPVTVCNDIYIEMRKMHKVIEKGDIMLRVNPEVVKQLKSGSGRWLQEMEEMSGKTILVKSDPSLHPEQFDIH